MNDIEVGYLADYPEYIPQLAQWLFEEWGNMLGEGTPEVRTKKLEAHMNRDKLPIAWIAHRDGQLLGTAALRVHDLDGREDLTPWLAGVFVGSEFRRQGVGEAVCAAVESGARARDVETLYLFTLDKQAWYSRLGWQPFAHHAWKGKAVDIMAKKLTKA